MDYFCIILTPPRWKARENAAHFAAHYDAALNFVTTQLLQMQLLTAKTQLIAAHLQLIWTSTGSTLIRDVGERGKQGNVEQSRSPTKPIGIVGMFTIRS